MIASSSWWVFWSARISPGYNLLTGAALFAIALTLVFLVLRAKRELSAHWVAPVGALFLMACGTTYWMEVWPGDTPGGREQIGGVIRLIMGLTAVGAAIGLPTWVPRVVGLLRTAQLSTARQVELAKSRERYQQIVEHANDGIWMVDAELCTLYVNGRLAEMLGYTEREMLGRSVLDFMDESAQAQAPLECCRSGASARFDFRFRCKNGLDLWAIVSSTGCLDAQGQFAGATVFLTDITGRKQIEDALREAQSLAQLGSWVLTVADGTVYLSRELDAGEATGSQAVLARFSDYQKVFSPESWGILQESVQESIDHGTPYEHELEIVQPGRPSRWIIGRGKAERNGAGEVVRLFGTSQDITARVRAREALRLSEEKLSLAIEATNLGVWDLDLRTGDLAWSDRCKAMFGVPPESCSSMSSFMDAIHPEDRSRVDATINRALIEQSLYRAEYRIIRPDGTMIWLSARGEGSFDANGRPIRATGTIQDITEQKRAQEELLAFNLELEARVKARTLELEEANEGLRAEMAARQRLEKELLEISEREQRRLGQDLHEGLGQELAGISLLCKQHATKLSRQAHAEAGAGHDFADLIADAIVTARELATDLYPIELERSGLLVALEDMAAQIRTRFLVDCRVGSFDQTSRFEHGAEIHLYRIVQACIGHAITHDGARRISVEYRADSLSQSLVIRNDAHALEKPGLEPQGGRFYLMDYRARLIGARMESRELADGGCEVSCRVPRAAGAKGGTVRSGTLRSGATPRGGGEISGANAGRLRAQFANPHEA